MTTTTRKSIDGRTIQTTEKTAEVKTAPEAAKAIGISTRRFGYVVERCKVFPTIVTGTELKKNPIYVYTAEQVAYVADEATRRDGNGRPL